jgi:hypothetical protein
MLFGSSVSAGSVIAFGFVPPGSASVAAHRPGCSAAALPYRSASV